MADPQHAEASHPPSAKRSLQLYHFVTTSLDSDEARALLTPAGRRSSLARRLTLFFVVASSLSSLFLRILLSGARMTSLELRTTVSLSQNRPKPQNSSLIGAFSRLTDYLHNPDPKRDRKSDRGGSIFTARGLMNLGCLAILISGLLTLLSVSPSVCSTSGLVVAEADARVLLFVAAPATP